MNIFDSWKSKVAADLTIPVTVPVQRTDAARRMIETGVAEFAAAIDERNHYKSEYERAVNLCKKAEHLIEILKEQVDDLKGRCTMYQIERDGAVAQTAGLRATVEAIRKILPADQLEVKVPCEEPPSPLPPPPSYLQPEKREPSA